jgi:hypothetical protein
MHGITPCPRFQVDAESHRARSDNSEDFGVFLELNHRLTVVFINVPAYLWGNRCNNGAFTLEVV